MSAEKRSVQTDALQTLGTLTLDHTAGRDAIHLAVEPVIAGETLTAGQHIGLLDGKATTKAEKMLGIVDPFLTDMVFEGDKFWLIVYPRQITSLRHVWEHPDFTQEAYEKSSTVLKVKKEAEAYLRSFAGKIETSYEELMEGAQSYVHTGDYMHMGDNESYSSYYDEMPEFWRQFEILTGISAGEKKEDSFFSCSC